MSVPAALVPTVRQLSARAKRLAKTGRPLTDALDPRVWESPLEPTPLARPLFGGSVTAGFPSPAADDYVEGELDLNAFLIQRPSSTFFFRVAGDSMTGAGIYPDDILVVDRAEDALHGCIVVALVDTMLTVKRLYHQPDGVALLPENDRYEPITITAPMELTVWGVVRGVVRRCR